MACNFFKEETLIHPEACNFVKKETLTQVFPCEFCEISKSAIFHRTSPVPASVYFPLIQFLMKGNGYYYLLQSVTAAEAWRKMLLQNYFHENLLQSKIVLINTSWNHYCLVQCVVLEFYYGSQIWVTKRRFKLQTFFIQRS